MDIVKGLIRLQSNLEHSINDAELSGDKHLNLLKRLHNRVSCFISSPTDITPEALEQMSFELLMRDRQNHQVDDDPCDRIAAGLKLLSNMRSEEIKRAYGPDSKESLRTDETASKEQTPDNPVRDRNSLIS